MAKTRKKRPPDARPNIIDVVTGVTDDDLNATKADLVRIDEDIKGLQHTRALLELQDLAQEIELHKLNPRTVTLTWSYEKRDSPKP